MKLPVHFLLSCLAVICVTTIASPLGAAQGHQPPPPPPPSCPAPAPVNPLPLAVACTSTTGQTCLDATFGNAALLPPGGLVLTNTDGTVPWTVDMDDASAVKQQADGKLVAIGNTAMQIPSKRSVTTVYGAAMVRYNSDGSLDPSFGSGGIFKFFYPGNVNESLSDGAIDSSGNILGVGGGLLMRVTPTGALDPSFNSVGYMTVPNFTAFTMRLQTDGKIVAAGISYDSSGNQIGLVVRVNTNGTLDTTFGTNGQVALNAFLMLQALELQTLNSQLYILVGGWSPTKAATVVRLTPSGTLDSSFGASGVATTSFCTGYPSGVYTISVDPISKSILAGGKAVVSSTSYIIFAFARFTSNGALDTTFGDPSASGRTGQTLLSFFGLQDRLYSIQPVLDAGGNEIGFLAGGTTWQSTGPKSPLNNYMALAKYHADGSIDTTFGTNGGVAIDFGNHNSASGGTSGTVIQTDGKFVMAGSQTFTSGPYVGLNFAIARLWP